MTDNAETGDKKAATKPAAKPKAKKTKAKPKAKPAVKSVAKKAPAKTETKKAAPKKATKKQKAANRRATTPKITAKKPETNKKLDPKTPKKLPISIYDPAYMVATLCSLGRIPVAPGTWGSLMGMAVFPLILFLPLSVANFSNDIMSVGFVAAAILVVLYVIGLNCVKSYQRKTGRKDGGEIIYDEFFAQILTYMIIVAFYVGIAYKTDMEIVNTLTLKQGLIFQLIPFAYFRLFDIAKPYPIWKIDQRDNSAAGVMLDDVVAAFYAATASIVTFTVLDYLTAFSG